MKIALYTFRVLATLLTLELCWGNALLAAPASGSAPPPAVRGPVPVVQVPPAPSSGPVAEPLMSIARLNVTGRVAHTAGEVLKSETFYLQALRLATTPALLQIGRAHV